MTNNCYKLQGVFKENTEFDAIMLTGDINRYYATDFHSSAGLVLLTPDRAVFMTDFRYIEAARAKLDGIYDVRMVTAEETYEKMVSELLSEWGITRVGFEEGVWTVKQHLRWSGKLKVVWKAADDAISRLRSVKADWEIERMTRAQRIAEKALEAVLPVIRVGMTEKQIAAELIYQMLKNGADKLSFDPIVVGGPNSALPHGEPGDRPVGEGDFLTMDFGCVVDGYCSDMTRSVAVGHADDEMRRVYNIVLEAQTAGINAAKAGVVGGDIHKAAERVIAEAGYGKYFGHGFGHGIGLEVHEEYGASPSEKRVLPAGAVISAEPGIYLPGRWGVRIEDCIVLRENGCDNLMRAPKELRIVGV